MDNKKIGAPFSKVFYTDGKIIAVNLDGKEAVAEYRDRDGALKSTSFALYQPQDFEVGEVVWVQLVGECVFIIKNERS